ncbi:MAG: hypothetical protein QG563_478 [Patescibacteria group bacterium]|nr:hypothetical protein [Patescibacteria group bacterium]
MKNKTFKGFLILSAIVALASCKTPSKTTSEGKSSDSKESFVEFNYSEHVKKLNVSGASLILIQVYGSKAFQLTASSYSQTVLVEEGVLVLQKVSLGTIIKFKDKIKGKIVNVSNSSLMVQFHDGNDGKIGPPIQFSAVGNGLYKLVTKNGVISYQGVNYTPSAQDVVLLIKYKERTSTGQDSFSASGIEVTGSGNSNVNDSNNGGNQQQQQNDFVPDANQQNQNQQPANPEPRNPPAQQGNPFNVPPRAPR